MRIPCTPQSDRIDASPVPRAPVLRQLRGRRGSAALLGATTALAVVAGVAGATVVSTSAQAAPVAGRVASAAAGPRPNGPDGSWRLVFRDEFRGDRLDTDKWSPNWFGDGGSMNNVGTYRSNVDVRNGKLVLSLSSPQRGALVHTDYGPGRYQLRVGDYVEAKVRFPGANGRVYNWPAFWASGPNWPQAGEHDVAEGLGGQLTVNYHSSSGSYNQGPVAGGWVNEFHTYGVHRKAGSADVYWDGRLVKSYRVDDNGAPQEIILNVGAGAYGGETRVGRGGRLKVGYVRAWRR